MSLLAYGLLVLSILGALSGISYKIYGAGYDKAKLEFEEAARLTKLETEKQFAQAARELEDSRAKRRVVYRTLTRDVDKIVDRPVYRNYCFDSDGVRVVNAALAGQAVSAREPTGGVSTPDTTGERAGSNSAEEARGGGRAVQ